MESKQKKPVLIQGGGDLASGVAAVLFRHGWDVVITELPSPLVVRRTVAFAEAVWEKEFKVEEIFATLCETDEEVNRILKRGDIAVVVDPEAAIAKRMDFAALVDARMLKKDIPKTKSAALPVIGLGPGFEAGVNCLAVVETNRGENLGKAFYHGKAQADTGTPAVVEGHGLERVLYSPVAGEVEALVEIGEWVEQSSLLAKINGTEIRAPFDGLIRGMLRNGIQIKEHTKLGDIDPRNDPGLAFAISDKALIIGEGVLGVLVNL
ncbi:MAG: EF2563 family selenium-dependent molybdenum hydroxylase system protein [Anaerolineaceae bacterium]|nr:EF2563 family selenium-dependent molybdenum hydroxylase system protein [Anaerolineaceae bacterium]